MTTTTVNEGDKVNLTIKKGTTYQHTFTYQTAAGAAVDISGYTARMQFRETADATTTLYEATTENGHFSVSNGINGDLDLSIPAATTAAWTFAAAVYDIELVSPAGVVIGLVDGRVRTKSEVTR